jgi:hypothetical protein
MRYRALLDLGIFYLRVSVCALLQSFDLTLQLFIRARLVSAMAKGVLEKELQFEKRYRALLDLGIFYLRVSVCALAV